MKNGDTGEIRFHCPKCKNILSMDYGEQFCPNCGHQLLLKENIYDFTGTTNKADEKNFYDHTYDNPHELNLPEKKSLSELERMWSNPNAPQDHIVRDVLGDLSGKTIVMVGNGKSQKEMAFLLERPKRLVYSDLSPYASVRIQKEVDFSGYEDVLRFAAIDAEQLPFTDASIDIVYGYAMVHHLPNPERFLNEASRVLRPGGKAVFMDDAYSPTWHFSKQTWLKPLMKRSHATTGISPEDYRFSMTGGFREQVLKEYIERTGCEAFFKRTAYLGYLASRGAEKLLPSSMAQKLDSWHVYSSLHKVDKIMSRFHFYETNQIRLIWGFNKQQTQR